MRLRPTILAALCLALFGCVSSAQAQAPGQAPSAMTLDQQKSAMINAINSDPHMTAEQKKQRIALLNQSVDYAAMQQPMDPLPFVLAGIGIFCLVGIAILKKQKEGQSEEEEEKPVKGKAAKPNKKEKKSKIDPKKSSAAKRPEPPKEPAAPIDRRPATQEAVVRIPFDERGISFFTSRPLPLSDLVEVTVFVENQVHVVRATHEEAEHVRAGNPPLVRSFTLDNRTLPWYDWSDYLAYAHYWNAVKADWMWSGSGIVACWQATENIDGDINGYFNASLEDVAPDVEPGEYDNDLFGYEGEIKSRSKLHLPKVAVRSIEAIIRRRRWLADRNCLRMSVAPVSPGNPIKPIVARLSWSLGTVRRDLLEVHKALADLDEAPVEAPLEPTEPFELANGAESQVEDSAQSAEEPADGAEALVAPEDNANRRDMLIAREKELTEFIAMFCGTQDPLEWTAGTQSKATGVPKALLAGLDPRYKTRHHRPDAKPKAIGSGKAIAHVVPVEEFLDATYEETYEEVYEDVYEEVYDDIPSEHVPAPTLHHKHEDDVVIDM